MKRFLIAALAATTALTGVATSTAASAQPGYGYERDRNHNGVPDRVDRWQRKDWERDRARWSQGQLRYYGGKHGYNGYTGRWREGQRYSHYRDRRYVISDYRAYHLPPPRAGYRYYRDDNGDVVMAAIASGVIGLIVGSAYSH